MFWSFHFRNKVLVAIFKKRFIYKLYVKIEKLKIKKKGLGKAHIKKTPERLECSRIS